MTRSKEFDEKKILYRTMDLFWKKGFYQTSLTDILHATGINRQSLYDTFGNKKALFLKAIRLYRTESLRVLGQKIEEKIQKGHHTSNILREFFCYEMAGKPRGCLMINSMVEFKENDLEIRAEIDNLFNDFKKLLETIIQAGQDQGEITTRLTPKQFVDVILNAKAGLHVGKTYRHSSKKLKDITDWTIKLLEK